MRKRRIAALMAGLNREYQRDFVRGMVREAQARNVELCIFACHGTTEEEETKNEEQEASIFDLPDLTDFDGVAALCATMATQHTRAHLLELMAGQAGRPQVIVDDAGLQAVGMSFDDDSSVRALARHMVQSHGCRDFAVVTGPTGNPVSEARVRVYLEELAALGIQVPEENILVGSWQRAGGQEAARAMLARERVPEVFFCCNDDMAFGVVDVLERNGLRVPEDVRVTGFDARQEAVGRGMTTILRPVKKAGEETVRVLCDWMEGHPPREKQVRLPTEIIYGDSCGCPLKQSISRHYVRALGDEHQAMERALRQTSSFSNELADVLTIPAAGEVMNRFAASWGMKELHVCVDPNFLKESQRAPQMGFPEKMLLLADHGAERCSGQRVFETRRLLPMLEEEHHQSAALAFCPLYCMQRNFGYVVLDLEFATTLALHPFLAILGSGLMSMYLQSTVRAYAQALEQMSLHDTMTGLLNRRGYEREAALMLRVARSSHQRLAMLSMDMDDMKGINDRFGHLAGDQAIRGMGEAVRRLEAMGMTGVHISGDEFLAVGMMPEDMREEKLLQGIADGMTQVNRERAQSYQISASVGIACWVPREGDTLDTYQAWADRQMYECKRRHKLAAGREGNPRDMK